MQAENLYKTWSSKGFVATESDIESIDLDMAVFLHDRLKAAGETDMLKRANVLLLDKRIRENLRNAGIYYIALPSGYPYQISSDFGRRRADKWKSQILVYSDKETAQDVANEICQRNARRIQGISSIAKVRLLGEFENLPNIEVLRQYGITEVVAGYEIGKKAAYIIPFEEFNDVDVEDEFYHAAPAVRFAIGVVEQAREEKRTKADQQACITAAAIRAAYGQICIAIPESCLDTKQMDPIVEEQNGVQTMHAFTDWTTLKRRYPEDDIVMARGDWDSVAKCDMKVSVNETILIEADTVKELVFYSQYGRMACSYIAECYGADLTADSSRTKAIFNDIYKSDNVWREFKSGLSQTSDGNVTFEFPEFEQEIAGVTARKCVESGLCANPAAAYHVLAQLSTDKDGSALRAFNDALLYE